MYYQTKYSKLESNLFSTPNYGVINYSPIEQIASSYSINHKEIKDITYSNDAKPNYDIISTKSYETNPSTTYTHINVNDFLNPDRPITQFIGKAEQIKHYISEAFEKTTGKDFPQHIIINVVNKEELKRLHEKSKGVWSDGIMGFAINKNIPEIFVRENHLDVLMLTIGHELGHVFTKTLINKHNEEAKAFAFEIEWIKKIVENNIAGLKFSFNLDPKPAKNGLHDIAFNFVKEWLKKGKKAMDVYWELVKGSLSIENIYMFDYKLF